MPVVTPTVQWAFHSILRGYQIRRLNSLAVIMNLGGDYGWKLSTTIKGLGRSLIW